MTVAAGVGGGIATGVLRSASDQRLAEHVRRGSSEAFETLFARYHPGVVDFCAQMLGSLDEAEDAAQLTFLVAYRDLVRKAHPVALRAWLYGIARHRCLMALRARRDHPIRRVDDPTQRYELSAHVGMRDDVRELLADVARLPDDQRAALVLAELAGVSHADIARVLECPRRKVKALVFQARSSLRIARAARDAPCAEIRELLTTLRGPALTRATLRRHLDDCPGCRAYREALRSRRRRSALRVDWAPLVGIKRCVVGAVAGSGGGAGSLALTGGALGGAGLAIAVTIAANGGPAIAPVGRDVGEPVRPIARAAAVQASFPARRAGSRVSAGVSGSRGRRGTTLERAAGAGRDAGATGMGTPAPDQETVVENDLLPADENQVRPTDDAAGDAGVAAPVPDPTQPVQDESLPSSPPATSEPPATSVTSAGTHAARPAPPRAGDPRPSPPAQPPPRPDPQPPQAQPPRPDNQRPATTPSRPDDGRAVSAPRPRPDTHNAAPDAARPPQSGRDGAREPNADTGSGRRDSSAESLRGRPD